MYDIVPIPQNPAPRPPWVRAALGMIFTAFQEGKGIKIPIVQGRPFVPTYHELRTAFEDSEWADAYKLRTQVVQERCAGLDPARPRQSDYTLIAWFVKKDTVKETDLGSYRGGFVTG